MDKFLLDNYNGIQEILHVDPVTGDFVIENKTDAQEVLDRNARARNERFGANTKSDMHLLAEVDLVTVMQWMKEGINVFNPHHNDAVRKKLNENPYLKARPNRVTPSIIVKGKR